MYLAQPRANVPEVSVPALGQHSDRFAFNRPAPTLAEKGKYYILRPDPNYDYEDLFVEHFWIALCTAVKVKRGGEGPNKNDVGFMMKKLEVFWDKSKPTPDPYNLRYCFFTDSRADFEDDNAICQDIVEITQVNKTWCTIKGGNRPKLQTKFKSYVAQWKEQPLRSP